MTTETAPTETPAVPLPAVAVPPAIANVGDASSSSSIGHLIGALAAAQGAMSHASKDANNPHFNKSYADLASVIDAAKGPLSDNGIAIIQRNLECTNGVRVQSILAHSSGEWISDGVLFMPVSAADVANPQKYGSAQTYARRYAFMTMVGLAPADDDANAASPAPRTATPAAATYPFDPHKGKALTDPTLAASDLGRLLTLNVTHPQYGAANAALKAAAEAELAKRNQVAAGGAYVAPTAKAAETHEQLNTAAAEAAAADDDVPFDSKGNPPVNPEHADAELSEATQQRMVTAMLKFGFATSEAEAMGKVATAIDKAAREGKPPHTNGWGERQIAAMERKHAEQAAAAATTTPPIHPAVN